MCIFTKIVVFSFSVILMAMHIERSYTKMDLVQLVLKCQPLKSNLLQFIKCQSQTNGCEFGMKLPLMECTLALILTHPDTTNT